MRFQGDRTDLVRLRKYQTTTSDSEVLSSFAGRIRRVAAVEKKLNLCIQSYSSGSHFLVFEIHPRNIPSRSPASFLAPLPLTVSWELVVKPLDERETFSLKEFRENFRICFV